MSTNRNQFDPLKPSFQRSGERVSVDPSYRLNTPQFNRQFPVPVTFEYSTRFTETPYVELHFLNRMEFQFFSSCSTGKFNIFMVLYIDMSKGLQTPLLAFLSQLSSNSIKLFILFNCAWKISTGNTCYNCLDMEA